MTGRGVIAAFLLLAAAAAQAGEADVVGVKAIRQADGNWRFDVAVRHADAGWKHYADRWDLTTPDGAVRASRTLLHPHEDEQPFTRSLGNVRVPAGITRVIIRAHDKVHGLGGKTFEVALPAR
jgi:hypothetical protein